MAGDEAFYICHGVGPSLAPKQWMTANVVVLLVFISSIGAPLFEEILSEYCVRASGVANRKTAEIAGAHSFGVLLVANLGKGRLDRRPWTCAGRRKWTTNWPLVHAGSWSVRNARQLRPRIGLLALRP